MFASLHRRYTLSRIRAAAWTLRARLRTRRVVWRDGIAQSVALPRAPRGDRHDAGAVIAVLGYTRSTCLVRSLVLQRWYVDQGEPVDVVIGVTAPSAGFKAHAWLDRADELVPEQYAEIHRLPAPDVVAPSWRRAWRQPRRVAAGRPS